MVGTGAAILQRDARVKKSSRRFKKDVCAGVPPGTGPDRPTPMGRSVQYGSGEGGLLRSDAARGQGSAEPRATARAMLSSEDSADCQAPA